MTFCDFSSIYWSSDPVIALESWMPVNWATLELVGFLVLHGSRSVPLLISPCACPSPPGVVTWAASSRLRAQQVCLDPSIDLSTLDLSTRIANFLYLAFCSLVLGLEDCLFPFFLKPHFYSSTFLVMHKTLQWKAITFEYTEVCCLKQILTQEQHSSPDLCTALMSDVAISILDGSLTEPALTVD